MLTIDFWMCDVLVFHELVFLSLTYHFGYQYFEFVWHILYSHFIIQCLTVWFCQLIKVNLFLLRLLKQYFLTQWGCCVFFGSGKAWWHIQFSAFSLWINMLDETKIFTWNFKTIFKIQKKNIFSIQYCDYSELYCILGICCKIWFIFARLSFHRN